MGETQRQSTVLLFILLPLLNSIVRSLFSKSEEKNHYFCLVEDLQRKYKKLGYLFVFIVILPAFLHLDPITS